MILDWNKYDVWTGPVIGNGTQIALGFNTEMVIYMDYHHQELSN